jgi:hypothetical protein
MDALARDAKGDDWLTVNVWTPEPDPGADLGVMVWIQLSIFGTPVFQRDIPLGSLHRERKLAGGSTP